jgi:pyruvate kinase
MRERSSLVSDFPSFCTSSVADGVSLTGSEGRPLAIALDTKGPEMRTGTMEGGEDVRAEIGHEKKRRRC